MEIRYECTMADYREAQFAHQRRSIVTYVLLFSGFFALAIGVSKAAKVGFDGASFELLCGTFFLLFPALFYVFWLRRIQISPAFGRLMTVVTGPEGLSWSGVVGQGTLKWAAFTRFLETQNTFMLYMDKSAFIVIPKRAFFAGQLADFRSLLTLHLPRK